MRGWQKQALGHIFARRPDGRRRHREALFGTARKNGKTELAAAIALYGLTMEGEGIEVYSCAEDRDQAKRVFGAAKTMVELDADLKGEVTPYRDVLEHRSTGSIYRALSSEAFTKEGLNPKLVIYDELHAAPTRELYDVMSLAMGTSIDPLMLIVTTAGVMSTRTEDESICYSRYLYGLAVIRGEIEDPTFFMAWWQAAEGSSYRDESKWAEANPGLGDILDLEDMRAKVRTTPESEFNTKRRNQWVIAAETWLPEGTWAACKDDRYELDRRLPVAVGIDVGLKDDMTAVLLAQRQVCKSGITDQCEECEGRGYRTVVRAKFYGNPNPPNTAAFDDWRMPVDELLAYLMSLRDLYPMSALTIDKRPIPGPAYAYDAYGLLSSEIALEKERLALIPIKQQGSWMVGASRVLYEQIVNRTIAHDGDEILAAHLSHVVPRQIGESGWRFEKPPGRTKKIDGAVALAMAVAQAQDIELRPERRAFLA